MTGYEEWLDFLMSRARIEWPAPVWQAAQPFIGEVAAYRPDYGSNQ